MSENRRMILLRVGESRPTRVPLLPDYQVKAGVDDTESRFSFLEVTVTHDLPRHIHQTDDEAFYLLDGELEVKRISQTPPRLLQISSPGGFEHFVEDLVEVQADGILEPENPRDAQRDAHLCAQPVGRANPSFNLPYLPYCLLEQAIRRATIWLPKGVLQEQGCAPLFREPGWP